MSTKNTILSRIFLNVSGKGMSTEERISLSKSALDNISFCLCSCSSEGYIHHGCTNLESPDIEHFRSCRCCQTYYFTNFIGAMMGQLGKEGRLTVFDDNKLTALKIGRRAYGIEKNGPRFLFKIDRHYNARDPSRLHFVKQLWQFDFEDIGLELLNTEDDDKVNDEFFRRYILREEEQEEN
jgi:hypothetical protein